MLRYSKVGVIHWAELGFDFGIDCCVDRDVDRGINRRNNRSINRSVRLQHVTGTQKLYIFNNVSVITKLRL